MNLNKLPNWQKGLILLFIISTVTTLVILQINSVETATKTETTLFNILQFIFSIIFAWLLSAFLGESQFIESQKKFAIGAFRRIKEIERSINRTEKYVNLLESEHDEVVHSKVIAIKGGLSSMKDTVRSSIADWSDIIGDELEISKEINKLQKIRNEDIEINKDLTNDKTQERDKEIIRLKEQLPHEFLNELEIDEDFIIENSIEMLAEIWYENNNIILDCFWEEDSGFASPKDILKVDKKFQLARGMTEDRMGALMIYDDNNQVIAVATNILSEEDISYDIFVEAMEQFYGRKFIPKVLNGNPLSAKVINIEDFSEKTERIYFQVEIEKIPEHPIIE